MMIKLNNICLAEYSPCLLIINFFPLISYKIISGSDQIQNSLSNIFQQSTYYNTPSLVSEDTMSIIVCDYSSSLAIKRYYHLSQTRRLHATTFALYNKGLPSLTLSQKAHGKRQSRFIVNSVVQPGVPPPSGPPFDFLKWMLGVMAFVLPFLTGKWGSFLRLKNEVDTTVQSIEDVVEAIEKVADGIDKAAEKIGKDLPEGSRLRRAADLIEHAAERASKDAHLLDNIIDTVQEAEENLEEYVEAIAAEGAHGHHPKSHPESVGNASAEEESHEASEEEAEEYVETIAAEATKSHPESGGNNGPAEEEEAHQRSI